MVVRTRHLDIGWRYTSVFCVTSWLYYSSLASFPEYLPLPKKDDIDQLIHYLELDCQPSKDTDVKRGVARMILGRLPGQIRLVL
jgi:hypothetical protein